MAMRRGTRRDCAALLVSGCSSHGRHRRCNRTSPSCLSDGMNKFLYSFVETKTEVPPPPPDPPRPCSRRLTMLLHLWLMCALLVTWRRILKDAGPPKEIVWENPEPPIVVGGIGSKFPKAARVLTAPPGSNNSPEAPTMEVGSYVVVTADIDVFTSSFTVTDRKTL